MAQPILMAESFPTLILLAKLASPCPHPLIEMHVPIPILLFINLGLRASTPCSNMCHLHICTLNHVHEFFLKKSFLTKLMNYSTQFFFVKIT